jgi:uncharacterized protein (DUF1697 family)
MTRIVVLLRGINLGATRRVSMPELRNALAEAGYEDVSTLLQSGNVVLSSAKQPETVARAVEKLIADRFGFDVDVIVRTGEELAQVVAADPLGDEVTDGKTYFVIFLSAEPDAAGLRELEDEDFAPDRFSARGREIYVWCPNGMRDSRLMRTLGKANLAPTATFRNWNTVTKLEELARGE